MITRLHMFTSGNFLELWPQGYPFPIRLPVITRGKRGGTRCWTWNGSLQKPTLKPSVLTWHPDGTKSHVWVTDGECEYLNDSTCGLAGSKLPLQALPEDA